MEKLTSEDRLSLLRFVCSFAWADLEVAEQERTFVMRMAKKLALNEQEQEQVQGWLAHPPDPEDIDPLDIPDAHRRLFVDAVRGMTLADGELSAEESENLDIFEALLGG